MLPSPVPGVWEETETCSMSEVNPRHQETSGSEHQRATGNAELRASLGLNVWIWEYIRER